MKRLAEWVRIATDRSVVQRALVTSVVVGTTLSAIYNAGDLLGGRPPTGAAWQIALTFLVPYLVSTISSCAAIEAQRAEGRQGYFLLEREIEAINRFPNQNPNPVMRLAGDGRLLYGNAASEPIASALRAEVGGMLPDDVTAELRDAAGASPPRAVEVVSGRRTFAVLPVAVPELGFLNLYGTDITASKVVERFPDRNPNPVLRLSEDDGAVLYANAASLPITRALGIDVGDPLPLDLADRVHRSLEHDDPAPIEVQGDGLTYGLKPVAIPEFGFINVYGTDVTAMKAINKFPDQNPNPVLRVTHDGLLQYANPASALVTRALGIEVGDPLPQDFFGRVKACLAADSPDVLEVRSEGHIFELLVVSVYEFAFINLYGTDVTAAREVEQAMRENERLLLNILPPSIAQRLRQGELVIADRFDEMTVLFADVVGFTQMSMRLSPSEVVDMLNRIFSICDTLADRYRLEKIKTIGDAYMVVGGLTPDATDHVERVADMALEMLAGMARLRDESGLDVSIRVGMHVGPAVAGVIGIKKFIYDVWGDTVNTASRMESHGVPGRVQVTEGTYERLKATYRFEPRGIIEVKGKGAIPAYLLVARLGEPALVGLPA